MINEWNDTEVIYVKFIVIMFVFTMFVLPFMTFNKKENDVTINKKR